MVRGSRRNAGAGPAPQVWLGVETATSVGSVAVWRDGLALESTFKIQGAHSERVLPAVDHALEITGTAPDEVSALIVGSGPGSFTGVRIAASVAKGWTMARQTPLFAYSSLLAVAAGTGVNGPLCALFDARRGQVYAACYQLSPEGPAEMVAPAAWRIEELITELAQRGLDPTFAGEGALAHRETITRCFHEGAPRPPGRPSRGEPPVATFRRA